MNDNASPTRRQILRFLAGAAGASAAGLVGARSGVLRAVEGLTGIDAAAAATEPAVRVALLPPEPGELGLPVEPGDGVIVLDNFGGRSESLGSCSHNGIDVFPTTEGTRTLVACVDGFIEGQRFAGASGAQGNAWILQDSEGISYRYHHIDEFAEGLEVGSIVTRGQPIATMGSTGNANSPHLHFEMRLDGSSGTAIDPLPFIALPIDGVDVSEPMGCS